ncbi:MAG: hypothetical protein AB1813_00295 [Verrucomicrobiota bacterium]|jgi:hypothetical protein
MIPIKILCGCGQKYAFDVEPVNGTMPGAVACPACGTDGTSAANAALAQALPAQPVPQVARVTAAAVRPVAASAVQIAAPALQVASANHAHASPAVAPPRTGGRLPGQMDRNQAEFEARAKISWGDAPEEVIKFLRIQGFNHEEASSLVGDLFKERAATIRKNGMKKVFKGIALVFVPIIALIVFLAIGYFPLKIFAVTVMVGCWGLWMVIKGMIMFLAPKSEPGDVAEQ